jgi:hypothetical protein
MHQCEKIGIDLIKDYNVIVLMWVIVVVVVASVVIASVVVVCIVVVSGCKAQVLQQVTSRLLAF